MGNQPRDRSALDQAREKVAGARLNSGQRLASASAAAGALEALLRTIAANDPRVAQARTELEQRTNDLKSARALERQARAELLAALTAWLPDTVAEEFQQLDADYPIALLPVRIETRFDREGDGDHLPQLKVRIYPDEIFADTHEEALTGQERLDGEFYWRTRAGDPNNDPQGDPDKEARAREAWRVLTPRYSAERAAWIVLQTDPDGPKVPGAASRPDAWNRPAEANLLPDRFLVIAFRDGNEIYREVSSPVREPLALTHDPQADPDDAAQNVIIGDEDPQIGLSLDTGVAWTLDYDRAAEAGMAVTITLIQPDDLLLGFDLVLVLGVKSSLDAVQSSVRLEELLDAHHYTNGVAFVRQGTPTNNTANGRSGFPPEDRDGSTSYKVERQGTLTTDESDGEVFTTALGIKPETAGHLAGFGGIEQKGARAMSDALWPVTLGYYLEQMMAPVFGSTAIGNARRHFVEHVRARGPMPAFRIGETPYGLLPVTSLTRWQPRQSINICGIVTAFTAAGTAGGSLIISGLTFPIAPGIVLDDQALITPKANLCLNGLFNTSGELVASSAVAANNSGKIMACGIIRDITRASSTSPGSITVGGETIPIAPGAIATDGVLLETGANLCLEAKLNAQGQIIEFGLPTPNADPAVTRLDFELPPLLDKLRAIWRAHISEVPQINRTGDPDADLLEMLAMDASAQEILAWHVYGWDFQTNLFGLLYADWDGWFNEQQGIANTVMGRLGHPELNPRVIWTVLNHPLPLNLPFVADPPLAEEGLLPSNYIPHIYRSSWETLKDEILQTDQTRPRALLYFLLRHAALTEYAQAAFNAHVGFGLLFEEDRVEPELINIVPGTENRRTVWQNLEWKSDSLTDGKLLGDFLLDPVSPSEHADPIKSYHNSLRVLENLPPAELDRLVAETLDVCSHRLDAWITSLATKRLKELRRKHPTGLHLGAYAWVENLRPSPPGRAVTMPDGSIAHVQGNTEGYVHAPSMDHAAAAAVLRNAHQSRPAEQGERYAINLSSERVRTALRMLDSIRQGQPLGTVLGYQFERGVHDSPLDLDRYIEPFRRLFPVLVSQPEFPVEASSEAIAARDVVDGYRLRNAWNEGQALFGPIDGPALPGTEINSLGLPLNGRDREALEVELQKLNEAVDGVADLLTAESVYQLVRGNTATAAASLETMATGARPPDPQIAHAQRSGTGLTHRVGVVLGGNETPAPNWPAPDGSPRAKAEPYLNFWAGALLGNPDNVWCRVRYPDPTVIGSDDVDLDDCTAPNCIEKKVTLAQLGLQPLDLLALALDINRDPLDSELDRRVIYFGVGPEVSRVKIIYTPPKAGTPPKPGDQLFQDWDTKVVRTFPEILEVAQTINAVIGGARPLRPADLLHPQNSAAAEKSELLVGEAQARVGRVDGTIATDGALRKLQDAIALLANLEMEDAPTLRVALIDAAKFGVAAAFPATRDGDTEEMRKQLRTQAASVRAELQHRETQALAEMKQVTDSLEPNPEKQLTDAQIIEKLTKATQAIFGDKFVFLPRFIPANPEELALGFNVVLPVPGASVTERRNAINKWLQQASPVRPSLGRWRKLFLYAGALGNYVQTLPDTAERFDVAQLPYAADEHWVGLKFPEDDTGKKRRHPSGRLSIVLHQPVAPSTGVEWAGLLLDEWTELIPSERETTGIAFHYDDPGAEAAQAVLLAIPPTDAATWDVETLIDTLRETLELAKLRAVDGRLLVELSQVLPAIYLTSNAANDAISTSLDSMKITNPVISITATG